MCWGQPPSEVVHECLLMGPGVIRCAWVVSVGTEGLGMHVGCRHRDISEGTKGTLGLGPRAWAGGQLVESTEIG